MTEERLSYFEERLTKEVAQIEQRINALQAERDALLRQLAKAEAERSGLQHTTRKNSLNRVIVENTVIKSLQNRKSPMRTMDLYIIARKINFDLKESTFRTYINRMKNKGIIKSSGSPGSWVLK